MKGKFKKNVGLIILLIIALVFPTSLNYQARLNMRIIVTGIAIDKQDDDYKVTAQIVKATPGNESPGTSAEIDFITDTASNLSEAVSKLAYKSGKVSAFSHTNFVIIGKSLFEEDLTKVLDYFIRDKIIKNSALLLFAEDKAEDEIQKTKNMDLSVGIGLQKVFLFKENESDGLMVTLIDFLNENKMYSGSAVASELSLKSNKDSAENQSSSGGSSGASSGSSDSGNQSAGSSSSSSGGSSSQSGSSGSGGGNENQYFEPQAPIVCFVGGKFKGKIEDEESVRGFMLANKNSKMKDITLDSVNAGRMKDVRVEIAVKSKKNKFKIRYENQIPCLDVYVNINKAEINEIVTDEIIASLTDEEYDAVKDAVKKAVEKDVAKCFETAKGFGCDIFNAYELAYKFKYKATMKHYKTPEEFLNGLRLNVVVNVNQMDY